MFERILVPLDGSALAESVLPHVVAIANTNDAQVFLLRVLDPVGAFSRPRSVDPFDWQVRKAEAESYLKSIAARLEKAQLKIKVETLEGKAAESVIDYAHDKQADLILMSSHGQSGISGWNVSSVVQKVILRAQISIMVVRAYKPVKVNITELHYQRILVPLDGSQRAEMVLPIVTSLARFHGAEIIVAHVVKKPEMPRRTPLNEEDLQLTNQITERNRLEASKYIEEIKSRLDMKIETRLLISENVSKSLQEEVERDEADLVILSAHGYSGESKWPYGSTVISFIAYGTTPLIVVQDLPAERIEPTQAEIAAREQGGR